MSSIKYATLTQILCVLAYYGAKPKGFAAKLKNKFRRHKSSENLRPGSPGELCLFP